MTCCCSTFNFPTGQVRKCEVHHRYFLDAKELVSVSKVLRSTWPLKKNFEDAPEERREHARERGAEVDALLTLYARAELPMIRLNSVNVMRESKELFLKAQQWIDARAKTTDDVDAQRILHDGEIAGTPDFVFVNGLIEIDDLKTVHDIDPMYHLQLGAYGDLWERMHGKAPDRLGIVHVTKRLAKPKVIDLPVRETIEDWRQLRGTWEMATRRAGKG